MATPLHPKLLLLPGLGANERFFEHQRKAFPHMEVPRWLPPERGESLSEYAKRMAHSLEIDGPFFLGGVSFGGMVALEIARHRPAKAVFLIGSCATSGAIPKYYRHLNRFGSLLPTRALAFSASVLPSLLARFSKLDSHQKRILAEMLEILPKEFVRWACSAIVNWSHEGGHKTPVFHIHGDRDRILPLRLGQPHRIVKGAGHVLNVTHFEEVNAFMAEHMKALAA